MRIRTISTLILLVLVSCKEKTTEATMTVEADSTSPAAATAEASEAAASPVTPVAGQLCSYVTEKEVTEIVGHSMKFAPPKPAECNLLSATGDTTKSVSFQIHDGTTLYDTMTASPGFEPLSGVGEKAVVAGATGMVLAVKNNRSYLGAVYLGADPAQAKEKSIALARKIVPRM